uniref:Uncharacterized protein n=1 Tax=Romanomermis culicivorax TaxID=13658 RepID=A0A915KEL8_ROMCU
MPITLLVSILAFNIWDALAQRSSVGQLTQADKDEIVSTHNLYRQMVKDGK